MDRDDIIRSTATHIRNVGHNISEIISILLSRAVDHDASKWSEEEWPYFERETPTLAKTTYGSPEYEAARKRLQVALDHHYASNSHHPEFYQKGITEMTLIDLLEMLADWRAAQLRHNPPGSFENSFTINIPRYKISDELATILKNTVKELGWE